MRGVRYTECHSSLGWEEERTTVDPSAGKKRTKLLTLVVRLPRLNDSALDGLATRGEHTTLDIHVLPLPF